jgi:hypothetical protein
MNNYNKWMKRIRAHLIVLLAGDMLVVLNAKIFKGCKEDGSIIYLDCSKDWLILKNEVMYEVGENVVTHK